VEGEPNLKRKVGTLCAFAGSMKTAEVRQTNDIAKTRSLILVFIFVLSFLPSRLDKIKAEKELCLAQPLF